MRVVRVNLRLLVAFIALAMASPAHAAPISAHAMVHTCCTPSAMKERIFSEASDLGAGYIRVDVELSSIFEKSDGSKAATPNWSGLDEVMSLSKKYDLPVLAILLSPPRFTSACPERWPDSGRCAAADTTEFGALAGQVAKHAEGAIGHWEVVNEPDGDWAFDGTAEEYARMLSAAFDAIRDKAPGDKVLLGGLMRPHEPGWLQRVFDTPGADAIHKFDIANVHLRGPVDAVVHRYGEFRSWLAARGFTGPLWVTEHGYAADPAFQSDAAYRGGDAAQAAYLTQTLVGLGEVGAPQVFVTLHDGGLDGEYATEGLERIDETPGGDYPVTRRPSFDAVRRLVDGWDQIIAWRAEQRDEEQEQRVEKGKAALWRTDARTARDKFREARASVHAAQRAGIGPRLDRARALLAGTRTALLWKSAIVRWHSQRAYDHAVAVALLKQRIAGG